MAIPPERARAGAAMRAAREAKGMNQDAVAKSIGISQRFYAKIEKGETPGLEYRAAISKLLGLDDDRPAIHVAKSTEVTGHLEIPIEGIVSAGPGTISEWRGSGGSVVIPSCWRAVRIEGDSAYPAIYSGQLALVDESRAVDINHLDEQSGWDLDDDVVLVRMTNDRALLKRFCFHPPGNFVLASVNGGRRSPLVHRRDILHFVPVVSVIWNDPGEDRSTRWKQKQAARFSEATADEAGGGPHGV